MLFALGGVWRCADFGSLDAFVAFWLGFVASCLLLRLCSCHFAAYSAFCFTCPAFSTDSALFFWLACLFEAFALGGALHWAALFFFFFFPCRISASVSFFCCCFAFTVVLHYRMHWVAFLGLSIYIDIFTARTEGKRERKDCTKEKEELS
jgi:hypothetical protein